MIKIFSNDIIFSVLVGHKTTSYKTIPQCSKKVVLDRPRLVDFVVGLLEPTLNLHNGPLKFYGVK